MDNGTVWLGILRLSKSASSSNTAACHDSLGSLHSHSHRQGLARSVFLGCCSKSFWNHPTFRLLLSLRQLSMHPVYRRVYIFSIALKLFGIGYNQPCKWRKGPFFPSQVRRDVAENLGLKGNPLREAAWRHLGAQKHLLSSSARLLQYLLNQPKNHLESHSQKPTTQKILFKKPPKGTICEQLGSCCGTKSRSSTVERNRLRLHGKVLLPFDRQNLRYGVVQRSGSTFLLKDSREKTKGKKGSAVVNALFSKS